MATNKDRAAWAESAVKSFMDITGTDKEDAASDLLCNLMHLCKQNATYGNFSEELERAQRTFVTESVENDDLDN